jgi:hypothetical protein
MKTLQVEYLARMGKTRKTYKILVMKRFRKRPIARPRRWLRNLRERTERMGVSVPCPFADVGISGVKPSNYVSKI